MIRRLLRRWLGIDRLEAEIRAYGEEVTNG